MDEIRRLENQIRQLQKELERQNAEAARMRQRLADENRRKLQSYEAEMRTSLDRHDKAVQREYERLLREYQTSANREIQERQLQMDRDYQKLLSGVRQKEKEWAEKTRQLEQLTANLKKKVREKDAASAREAEKYMAEAEARYKDVDKKPHEKFFPKRIKSFHNAICEAMTLYNGGLCEAAIAVSISAGSGLNRLGFDVDEQYEEWNTQYRLFKDKAGLMQAKLAGELAAWHSFTKGTKTGNLTEKEKEEALKSLDYWTDGIYGEISSKIDGFGAEIEAAQKDGIPRYLKREQSLSIEELEKGISDMDTMNERLKKAFALYKERYTASCQRADWGEMIIDFLTDELNLVWIEDESRFRPVAEEKRDMACYAGYMRLMYGDGFEEVDTREWLELVFSNSLETRIFIYIVPYERDMRVENRIVVYVDYAGVANEEYSRQIYAHICESIRLEDDGVINFATDVDLLKADTNAVMRAAGRSIESKIQKMR